MGEQNVRLFAHSDIGTETAQRILRQIDKQAVVADLRRITEGGSTSNYDICLEGGKRYLLKIYPQNDDRGKLEIAAYRYAAQFTKVPEVYLFDNSLAVFPKPYAVIEFIDGVGLNRYVMECGELPELMARTLGERLAALHGKEYARMSLLDESLTEQKTLIPIPELHAHYLNGKPGQYIRAELREEILNCLHDHSDWLESLGEITVFCHGDFNPGNIIVGSTGEIWLIDFEYCLAAPPYYDIGKFFRDRPGFSDRFTQRTYESFIDGYNSQAARPLRKDWYRLSRLMDMTSLLHLLNYESAACWAQEIEEMLRNTMSILRESL